MSEEMKTAGYAKPPATGKFRAGDGRKRGHRPKGSLNKKTIAQRQLDIANQPETVRKKDGTAVRLSPREIVTTRLKNLAMTKDDKAVFKLFFDHVDQLEKTVAETQTEAYPFTDLDRAVMDEMYRRMKACKESGDE
jgi:hypothetical protein